MYVRGEGPGLLEQARAVGRLVRLRDLERQRIARLEREHAKLKGALEAIAELTNCWANDEDPSVQNDIDTLYDVDEWAQGTLLELETADATEAR